MTARRSIAARLLAGQALVGIVGGAALWGVAALVGPVQFRRHLDEAGAELSPAVTHHAERAFRDATTISLATASAVGVAAALLLSLYLARRLGRSVRAVAAVAEDLAQGRWDARIEDPQVGVELTSLAAAFNEMSDRLQAVEQSRRRLLADLAHELRTPLAVLDGYLEGIEDGVVAADASTVALMRAQAARLARLAGDVADVSRAEEGQVALDRRTVAVDEVLRDAAAGQRRAFTAKGVALVLDLAPGLLVQADPARLGQVVGNLLDNALRHTPAGGTVTVRSGGNDRTVTVEVADTGEGIAAEHVGHVFERFYRADPARDRTQGGSGIGLAISKALVEAHGGRIGVSSPGPGAGAVFTVQLPATAA